jgi:hypothetical protein
MGAGGRQGQAHPLRHGEKPLPPLALAGDGIREALASPRADLDLRGDQLTGDRVDQQLVPPAGLAQVLEAMLELERLGVDDRELLLDPDGEVSGSLEDLPGALKVEALVGPAQRS